MVIFVVFFLGFMFVLLVGVEFSFSFLGIVEISVIRKYLFSLGILLLRIYIFRIYKYKNLEVVCNEVCRNYLLFIWRK